jgi:hypothetical protein
MSCVLQACPSDDDGGGSSSELGEEACPERVRDTLGFEYGYDCDAFELSIVAESPEPPMCSGPDVAVFRLHPALGMPRICYFQTEPGSTGGTTSADACRPLACASREECPGGFPCVRGICRVEPLTLTEDSAYALCFADIPWPEQCSLDAFHPDFLERIAPLMEACSDDSSCAFPSECPQ